MQGRTSPIFGCTPNFLGGACPCMLFFRGQKVQKGFRVKLGRQGISEAETKALGTVWRPDHDGKRLEAPGNPKSLKNHEKLLGLKGPQKSENHGAYVLACVGAAMVTLMLPRPQRGRRGHGEWGLVGGRRSRIDAQHSAGEQRDRRLGREGHPACYVARLGVGTRVGVGAVHFAAVTTGWKLVGIDRPLAKKARLGNGGNAVDENQEQIISRRGVRRRVGDKEAVGWGMVRTLEAQAVVAALPSLW